MVLRLGLNGLKAGAVAMVLALSVSACQSPQPVKPIQTITTQAKGEWALQSLASPNQLNVSALRYRISLRVTRQEFSLAAPCARLLGQYHSNATVLRFKAIEQREVVCANEQEAHQLQQLLQQTRRYRLQNDDAMQWLNQQGQVLAVWQRIYL